MQVLYFLLRMPPRHDSLTAPISHTHRPSYSALTLKKNLSYNYNNNSHNKQQWYTYPKQAAYPSLGAYLPLFMPFLFYSDITIQRYTLCTHYGRYTTICTVHVCMCCFPSFFGVRIPSLTAAPYAIWFGDPRLRKRELPSSLCPFFVFLWSQMG